MDATGGNGNNSPVWPIVDDNNDVDMDAMMDNLEDKISNLEKSDETPSYDNTTDENIAKFEVAAKSKDSRLESRKSATDNSFTLGSTEEADNVKILKPCNGLLIMAFDPRKSLDYKVVQVGACPNSDLEIQVYSSEIDTWSLPASAENGHRIPHGLHRGRNFLQSFGGSIGSDDPMLVLIDIPGMLHLEGRLFESCGCLLLLCRNDIGSREFTIYELMKGSYVWMVRLTIFPNVEVNFYLPNVDILVGGYLDLTLELCLLQYEHVVKNPTCHGLDVATVEKTCKFRPNRYPVITSSIHIESCKSPTIELFDVDSGRISIVTVNTKEYHSDVLARSQG
ncbi:hypothetical protein Tco_0012462 [Tanacetum coccineum]